MDPTSRIGTTLKGKWRLDRLLWIPAGNPWHKGGGQHVTPAEHRAAMVRLAIDGEPRFVLEACELARSGPSYTLDTVRELQARLPGNEWFLILGQDQYARLGTWKGWRELLGLVTLAVAPRDGAPVQASAELAAALAAEARNKRRLKRFMAYG